MGHIAKALFATFLLCFSSLAHAQTGAWTVSELAGQVTVADGARTMVAQRGTVIAPGATLSTGPQARVVVVRGRDFMTVAANSRIRVPAATEKRGLFEIVQEWGNAVFKIEKQAAPHFGVRTPYLAAVVKGTTFSITVTQEGASLQVVEGAVETSTIDGGAVDLIRAGIVASVTSGDPMRLTVQGRETRQIDSPLRVAPAESASSPSDSGSATSAPDSSASDSGADSSSSVQMIAAVVIAKPVDFGKATDGLVSGSSAAQSAGTEAAPTHVDKNASTGDAGSTGSSGSSGDKGQSQGALRAGDDGAVASRFGDLENDVRSPENSGSNNAVQRNTGQNGNGQSGTGSGTSGFNWSWNGWGNGNAASNGNSNAQGNSGATGNLNGQGSGNAQSNGNGSGAWGFNWNWNGRGNGNATSNGNSNAQGNSGGTGNLNGQGGGNAQSNGNGSGTWGFNGNWNGRGNGNAQSNGNGNGRK